MRYAVLAALVILAGCATPVGYTNQPLTTYDKDTEYRSDDTPTGFNLIVYY
jgi:hypothetical protein